MADETKLLESLTAEASRSNAIPREMFDRFSVKRGLRNADGTGVLVGLTTIGEVHGYIINESEKVPVHGRLFYRGYNVADLIEGFEADGRFGYEEVCYLLLTGSLPTRERLDAFSALLGSRRNLPGNFAEDMILKSPSSSVMNKLARSILASYSYDANPDDIAIGNVVRQCVELVARVPTMVAYGYQALAHYYEGRSLFLHNPRPDLGTAENLLRMIRPTAECTRLEAQLLDLCLVLHAEHGGGNNSSFAVHVVSSTDTDTYSALASAAGSLKGPKHGGANQRVVEMLDDMKREVKDWKDDDEVRRYLRRQLDGQAFDRSGLIYGMGHAVYTLSDPRARILKERARVLAEQKGRVAEFELAESVERLAPEVFQEKTGTTKTLCANVDLYSGQVYALLGIPASLYTPLFAIARVPGWCAHRIEELVSGGKVIRPAYKSVLGKSDYVPLAAR